MGMLVMLVNYLLALTLIDWLDSRWVLAEDAVRVESSLLRRWQVAGSLTVVLWVGISLVLLNLPLGTESVKVAAIQPKISTAANAIEGNDELVQQTLERMKAQTREVDARFAVWPEGAFLWDPQVDDKLDLRGLAIETNTYLATGYGVFTEKGLRNEATVISPQGEFLGVFGKDHPVVFAGETSLSQGSYPVYDTPLGKIATIICYDMDYTDTVRKMVRQGAQLVGVPSQDWGSIADKHFTHVVFRAVENRVAMVKADGSFDSAIIDPNGRILALEIHPEGGEATLVADVPLGNGKGTLTTLLGDWTGWLALAGMIFFGAAGKRLEKKVAVR
jgi:apolipoprotein N-acyltransferase